MKRQPLDVLPSAALAAFIILCGNLVLRWMRFTLFRGTDMTDVRWEQASLLQTTYLCASSCLQVLLWVLLAYFALRLLRGRYQFIAFTVLVGLLLTAGELDMAWYRLSHRHATLNNILAFISEFSSWREQYGISTTSALKTSLKIIANTILFLAIYYIIRQLSNTPPARLAPRFRWAFILPILIALILTDGALMGYTISTRRNQWVEVARQNPFRVQYIDYIFRDWFINSSSLNQLQFAIETTHSTINRPTPLNPFVTAAPSKPDILVLAVEGLNSSLVSTETTPSFIKFSERAVLAKNHYSSGNVTEYGILGLLYGEPLKFYRGTDTLPWMPTKTAQDSQAHSRYLKRLSAQGYTTRAIAPGVINWAGVSSYISDFTEPGLLPASTSGVSEAIIDQLRRPGPNFVFAYYGETHFPYNHSERFSKFQPETPNGFNFFAWDLHAHENEIRNRYRNCLLEFDSWLASLLDRVNLGKTIVVITGDHGEEFFERGRLSHASSLDKPQISTPLVIWIPGYPPSAIEKITSHLDLMETLLHVLGLPPEAEAYGRSFFLNENLAHAAVAMMNRPESPTIFAIVTEGRKILIDATRGKAISETYPDDTELPIQEKLDLKSIAAVQYFLANR